MHLLTQKDNVKKLVNNGAMGGKFEKKSYKCFHFKFTRPSYQRSKHKSIFFQHLNASITHFLNNFDDLDFTKYSWIQNPFMGEEDDEF